MVSATSANWPLMRAITAIIATSVMMELSSGMKASMVIH